MNDKVILCVEDNMQVQAFNKQLLEAKGFTVRLAMTLAEAREEIAREMPSLILLDIHLPDGNGLDFLRELRKTSTVPVVALTDDSADSDLVTGFASGCDDYVPKPYSFSVLYARIDALLRRMSSVPDIVTKGSLKLDVLAGQAFLKGEDLLLARKEFLLLLLFIQNEGKTLSAGYLYEKIWGRPMNEDSSALRNALSRFRKKLSDCDYAINRQGNDGYCFEKA